MNGRDLSALLDMVDPAWPLVQEWLASARNHTEVLEPDNHRRAQTLLQLQVTTHSVLGSVAWETGGVLVDHGWLRLLGSGHLRMQGNLLTWNGLVESAPVEPPPKVLLVAHDVVGGCFALNGGAFNGKQGNVFYFAPETLRGTATFERDHAATADGGALGGRPRRLGRGGATQGAGGTW
jgi:Protein of unknown function DUF2625